MDMPSCLVNFGGLPAIMGSKIVTFFHIPTLEPHVMSGDGYVILLDAPSTLNPVRRKWMGGTLQTGRECSENQEMFGVCQVSARCNLHTPPITYLLIIMHSIISDCPMLDP